MLLFAILVLSVAPLAQVAALQAFHRDPSAANYSIRRETLTRTEVEDRFGAFLPLRNHGEHYHVFVSYRLV